MRRWAIAGGATGTGVLLALVLLLPGLGPGAVEAISDLAQLAAAFLASAGCVVAARRADPRRRRPWAWFAAGSGSWCAGQAVWSWYELVLHREVPFPSAADIGFLLFPVGMTVGLVIWLGSQGGQLVARGRDVLDGAIIAGSLLSISWVTTIGSIADDVTSSWVPLALSLAYPVGDLIVATMVLIAVSRGNRDELFTLGVLGVGLGGLAFSDSAYVYLTQVGSYTSASIASSGWILGFLLLGAAGLVATEQPVQAATRSGRRAGAVPLPQLALPYVPLAIAGMLLFVDLLRPGRHAVVLSLGLALTLLVLVRQFAGLLDNRRLLVALGAARDELEHQATHDGLTGLPNRDLFATRLRAALRRSTVEVSVLFCDLDDFKQVNDRFGHDVGDELLVVVAARLLQCVRTGDTVARLGGDEFAILVESGHAVAVAERVVELLTRPVELGGRTIPLSASVGIAHHHVLQHEPPAPREVHLAGLTELRTHADRDAMATLMLRQADTAMYAAKHAGKGRAVAAQEPADQPAEQHVEQPAAG